MRVRRRVIVQVPAVAPVPFGTVDSQTGTWEYKNKALGAGVEVGPNGASLVAAQVRAWQLEHSALHHLQDASWMQPACAPSHLPHLCLDTSARARGNSEKTDVPASSLPLPAAPDDTLSWRVQGPSSVYNQVSRLGPDGLVIGPDSAGNVVSRSTADQPVVDLAGIKNVKLGPDGLQINHGSALNSTVQVWPHGKGASPCKQCCTVGGDAPEHA